ncbi:hypothetical protein BDN71DRAFT_1427530 [Pleurotus eryngii]|uniref:Uncharacterized protein n=1 Tax=Pleurotus eryngii TaxID=5323 RepID=A0A9P6DD19_PLEER|nr:hypothetical protein BDN71DRAFT_1427530 [Pleurotus eryngii]
MLTPASVAEIRQQLQDIFLSNPKSTISRGVLAISLRHLDSIITAYETQNNIQLMSTEDMCELKALMAENPEREVTPDEISVYITGIHPPAPVKTDQPQSTHLSDFRRPSEPRRQRSNLGPRGAVLGSLHTVKPNLFRRSKLQLHAEEVSTAMQYSGSVLQRIDPQFEDMHHQLGETRSALSQCESKLEGIGLRLDDVQTSFESSHSELKAHLANMANHHADIQAALDSTISQQEIEHANLCSTMEEIQSDICSLRRDVGPLAESHLSDRIIPLEESIRSICMDLESCDEKYVSSTRYTHSVDSLENRFHDSNILWEETSVKSWSDHVRLEKHISQFHSKVTSEIRQIVSTQSHYQKSLDELIVRIDSQWVTPEFSPSRRNSGDDEYIIMDGHKSLSDELKDANIKVQRAPTPLQVCTYVKSAL